MSVSNPSTKSPLVTVCLITYNHAAFIEQSIQSILNQKTDFYFNVIIADDCSKDGTAEIVKQYANQYPEIITTILQNPNVGAGRNYGQLIAAANGKYIAYLEGDDYWTDNNKLQEQINILEANPNYVSCFTNVLETFSEDINDEKNYLQNGCFPKTVIGYNEMIYKNYIQTCSIVFRNNLVTPFPDWFIQLKVGDWPLHILLSQFGDSFYIHKVMAVHRNHSMGLWSSKTKLNRIEATLEAYDALKANSSIPDNIHYRKAKSNVLLSTVKYCISEKKIGRAFKNFVRGFMLYPKNLYEKKLPF